MTATKSVVTGLSGTARVITSAALIMISVFGSFVLGDDPIGKLFGVGLAAAVFIDATLVRMVLVPATMSLLGRANWWLPTWMERVLPHIDFESATHRGRSHRDRDRGRGPGRARAGCGLIEPSHRLQCGSRPSGGFRIFACVGDAAGANRDRRHQRLVSLR